LETIVQHTADTQSDGVGLLGTTEEYMAWHIPCRTPLLVRFPVSGGVTLHSLDAPSQELDKCPGCNQVLKVKDIGHLDVLPGSLLGLTHDLPGDPMILMHTGMLSFANCLGDRYTIDTLRSTFLLLQRAAQDYEAAYARAARFLVHKIGHANG